MFGVEEYLLLHGDNLYTGVTPMPVTAARLYGSFSRTAFAISVALVVLLCHRGWGGWVNKFLSWNLFVPFSKLSYCAYLVHIYVIYWFEMTRYVPPHMDETSMILSVIGHVIVSYMMAYFLSMTFEVPIIKLERIWLFPPKAAKPTKDVINKN
jgi:peptidoglycan/LPS O-acetylase OafA/YrhL